MSFAPPVFNLTCNLFNSSDHINPDGPPFSPLQKCNARSPRQRETAPLFTFTSASAILVLGFPVGTRMVDGTVASAGPAPPPLTLIEFPAGSGQFYEPLEARVEARGFPNTHLNAYCVRLRGVETPQ